LAIFHLTVEGSRSGWGYVIWGQVQDWDNVSLSLSTYGLQ